MSEQVMDRFRKILTPLNLGKHVLGKDESEEEEKKGEGKPEKNEKLTILNILRNGHDFNNQNDDSLFKKLSKDPLVYFSAATSNYVKYYSPFRARRFMTARQLNNRLVYPHAVKFGTAFVLPTGHVINKMYGMDDQDMQTWNPPPQSPAVVSRGAISLACTTTDPVHKIGLYGFAGADRNKTYEHNETVEFLVCNCSMHKDLLEVPIPADYSSDPLNIQVNIEDKIVLLPGPGSTPIKSTQVVTAAHE